MLKALFLLSLIAAASTRAQSVIQGPRCHGVIHGIVYGPFHQPAAGLRVIAFPLGVNLGARLPTARADANGEYRFERVCHGKYGVIPDDPEAGYPRTFPEMHEFLYGIRVRAVRLTQFHPFAELPVNLPPKVGTVLLHMVYSAKNAGPLKYAVRLSVPGQRGVAEESFESDDSTCEFAVPSGKTVNLQVGAAGYKDIRKSILVDPGDHATLEFSLEPIG